MESFFLSMNGIFEKEGSRRRRVNIEEMLTDEEDSKPYKMTKICWLDDSFYLKLNFDFVNKINMQSFSKKANSTQFYKTADSKNAFTLTNGGGFGATK